MSVIEVRDLGKSYGGRPVLDGVSFAVERGEIFGVLGPNGAGKTTTVECVEGLRRPDRGSVRVLGLDPQDDGAAVRRRLGVQLQESRLPEKLKTWEAIDLYASFYDEPADWRELLDLLGMTEHRDTRFGRLSGGQQQRLSIALALVGRPEVAVLDELTTGLDPQARRDTWKLIEQVRDTGVTIVLVSHVMEEVERLCDRVAILDRGTVVAVDTPHGVVGRVGARQRLRFRPSAAVPDAVLAEIPEVSAVSREGDQVVVSGDGDVVHAVTAVLARRRVVAHELRIEQQTLDDAFVALTGRPMKRDDAEVDR